jgi:hypothetical protein
MGELADICQMAWNDAFARGSWQISLKQMLVAPNLFVRAL